MARMWERGDRRKGWSPGFETGRFGEKQRFKTESGGMLGKIKRINDKNECLVTQK